MMTSCKVSRRRHPADRYLFSNIPPVLPPTDITSTESSVRNLQDILRKDLEQAFPATANANPTPNSLTALFITLSAATLPYNGDSPSKDFVSAVLQTGFIDDLLHALRLACRAKAAKRQAHFPLTRILSLLHSYVSASELLASRLAENHLSLPLLLSPMYSRTATDIAIPLAEETLHASPRSTHFELAPLVGIVDVIESLSPFQLGTMCRVLALYIDERDNSAPCNMNADTASVCTLSPHAPCNPDWRQIEKPAELLKARRSYLDNRGKLARERNQAALLATPYFLNKLVKIISIPPPCRDDIHVIDDALRAGFQTSNPANDDNDEDNNNNNNNNNHINDDQNNNNLNVINDAIAAENVAALGNDNAGFPMNNIYILGNQGRDDIRERILLMVFRRLTGGHAEDNRLIRADTWSVLNGRIEEAEQEWADTGFVGRAMRLRPQTSADDHEQLFGVIQPVDGPVEMITQNVNVQPGGAGGVVIAQIEEAYVNGVDDDVALTDEANGAAANNGTDNIVVVADGDLVDHAHGANGIEVTIDGNAVDMGGGNEGASDNGQANNDDRIEDELEKMFSEHLLSIMSNVMLTHQVEALFIMYTMLGGKRRADVRARLIAAGIFPSLNRFFDALDWSDPLKESRTEDTLKVHLLRLIHYLCDAMDENTLASQKKHLFTDSEREVISAIEDGKWTEKYVIQAVGMVGRGGSLDPGLTKASLRLLSDRDQRICDEVENGTDVRTDVLHFCSIHSQCNICAFEMDRRTGKSYTSARTDKIEDSERHPNINHERGLMMKVVSVLMNTTGRDEMNIGRRYLLSGCVETFQRGATMAEKTFVGRQGLLQHLVEQLCCSKQLTSHMNQFRQTSFDLLGHLIKWNRELFGVMNGLLQGSHRLLSRLLDAVSDRLIDSNVFVRSVALSLERFRAEDEVAVRCGKSEAEHTPYDLDKCLLWEFVEEWRVRIVYDLMASVRVDDVNYENISCVNTTLIMFVVSCNDEHALDKLLLCVADYARDKLAQQRKQRKQKQQQQQDENECVNGKGGAQGEMLSISAHDVLHNFHKVVDFWINYYRYQGTDVNSLEMSTNIAFDRFVYIAGLLQERLPASSEAVRRAAEKLG